uniref:WD_REPEATS_REGION domain-containing protein n=1 Tax=Caenorhabditis tropicalis TaxID=1561998 RepID=A0A1I7UT11_9PELO
MSAEESSEAVQNEAEPEVTENAPRITLRAERAGIGALLANLRGENLSAELDDLSTQSQSSGNEDVEEPKQSEEVEEPARPMNRKEKRRLQRLQELELGSAKKKVPEVIEPAKIPSGLKLKHSDRETFSHYNSFFGYLSTRTNNYVHSALQNPDGTRAITASQDRYLRVFSLENHEVLWKHNTANLTLDSCWENSGKGVFSSSKLRPIQLFETETGEILGAYNGKDSGDNVTEAMCITQSENTLIGGFKNQFQMWDIEYTGNAKTIMRSFDKNFNTGFRGMPMTLDPHPTMPDLFAAAGTSPFIATFSKNWKNAVSTMEGSPHGYTNIRFSRDGIKLYASERTGDIHCFDTRMNMMTQVLKREMTTQQRTRFDIDASGRLLYSGTSSGDVVVYDLHEFNEELQPVLTVNVSSVCVPCVSVRNEQLVICTGQRVFPDDPLLSEDEEKREAWKPIILCRFVIF